MAGWQMKLCLRHRVGPAAGCGASDKELLQQSRLVEEEEGQGQGLSGERAGVDQIQMLGSTISRTARPWSKSSPGGERAVPIRVLVRPDDGGGVPLRMDPWQTVMHAKMRVEMATGVPADEQRLIAFGRELRDDAHFAQCGLRSGTTIQLLRRVCGGSAAARAQLAMKRKKERQAMMDSMQDDGSSSDEENWLIPERPDCVANMNFDLQTLMVRQFDEFQEHLTKAIEDPGENQERLEELETTFDKLLYRGFVQGKGFYAVNFDFADVVEQAAGGGDAAAKVAEQEDSDEDDEDVDAMPAFQRVPYRITHNTWFKNFIVFAIVMAGVIVGTNTYLSCDGHKSCYADVHGESLHGNRTGAGPCQQGLHLGPEECLQAGCCYEGLENTTDASYCWERGPMPECYFEGSEQLIEDVGDVLGTIDSIILYIFTFECVMSILSHGKTPWMYFAHAWNSFDFFIVVMCYLPDSVTGGNVAVLRLLRLMRLLKLLHTIDNLQVILLGLSAGFGSIGYIMILMTLVYYLFAIVAWMLYGQNDGPEFKNLDTAMLTLFRMSTMEDWTDVMYINMFGCANYGFGSYCYDDRYCVYEEEMCKPEDSHAAGYWAATFFSVFVMISGYVVMSLFIGVIAASMEEETEKQVARQKGGKQKIAKSEAKKEIQMRKEQGIVVRPSLDLLNDEEESREPNSNPNIEKYLLLCDQCDHLIKRPWFGWFITCCILVAAVVIGWQTYPVSEQVDEMLNAIDFVILLVFTFELALKFFACGLPKHWWRFFLNGWNIFDFFVVAACYLPTSWTGGAVAVLRLLRLLRVLKLFKAVPQLQIIMSGLAQGMGSIVWIALLLGLMFYLFGIVAIMFFRPNDPVHFGSLDLTFLTLFRAATFEDWTDIMYIAMYGCQMWSYGEFDMRCENNKPHGRSAALFFVVFIILSALIMLNLVIGSICSSMSDAQEEFEMDKARRDEIAKVVAATKTKGKAYGLQGINHAVVEAWMGAFSRFDSSTNSLALEASILQEDLDKVLELIGETGVLSSKSRELIKIRANHTIPIGMIDMMNFIECLAEDLMKERIRGLSHTTGMIVVQSCSGLDLNDYSDGGVIDYLEDKETFDPYVKIFLNVSAALPDWCLIDLLCMLQY
jgi:voltage-gated sodium channel